MTTSRLAAALCLFALACSQPAEAEPQIVDGWASYGAGLAGDASPLTIADVLADPAAHDGSTLTLEGTIDEACPKKGCWMTFSSGDETLRVTFQDYGFFVPLDSAGRTARMEGTFKVREIPVDEARHYLEDEGRLEEAAAITEPQRGYEFVATGVLLQEPTDG